MAILRTTVIMKTDIVGSTSRTLKLSESELDILLNQHKKLIAEIAVKNQGAIIKGEGDAFWLVFPSVTTAALAAIEMHQKLHLTQVGRGDEHRLAIRAVITIGDVLHRDNDLFGYAMSLTARIESVTPPDEIYLSYAAWLVLNKVEVPNSYVDTFTLKDIREPERVYKIEQKHRAQTVTDQIIVFTDIKGFTSFVQSSAIADVEEILIYHDDLVHEVCDTYDGVIRNVVGDGYMVTFSEVPQALCAVERMCQQWQSIVQRYGHGLRIGVHKGDIHILRSYIFSHDINVTHLLADMDSTRLDQRDIAVVVSQRIKDEMQNTEWEQRLRELSRETLSSRRRAALGECGAYQFVLDSE